MVKTGKIWYLPIVNFAWFIFTFLITYVRAVQLDHVKNIVPLLSDIGAKPPVSCIFGQMLNIGSFLVLLTMYVRFLFVKQQAVNKEFSYSKYVTIINWASLALGAIYCFGLSLVANFQITAVQMVHLAGVVVASGFAGFYQISQTLLTFLVTPNSDALAIGRMYMSVSTMITLGLYGTFYVMCLQIFYEEDEENPTFVKLTNKAFVEHMVSALLQWKLALTQLIYLTTYSIEFIDISISEPKAQLKQG